LWFSPAEYQVRRETPLNGTRREPVSDTLTPVTGRRCDWVELVLVSSVTRALKITCERDSTWGRSMIAVSHRWQFTRDIISDEIMLIAAIVKCWDSEMLFVTGDLPPLAYFTN
jgi:hypothetical protein